MANQTIWTAKSQIWSKSLTSIYDAFPKMPEGLSDEAELTQQAEIDQFIQRFFAQNAGKKAECLAIYQELMPFVSPLMNITDHVLLRYKEIKEIESAEGKPRKHVICFLDMVAKIKGITELAAFCKDPIYKGCVRIAYALDAIPFQPPHAHPVNNWMDPSLAQQAVEIVRGAEKPPQNEPVDERCQAIFKSLKDHMEQLRPYYQLPALGQWSFYNACLAIFPWVAPEEDDWQEKIHRLALARLSSDELTKVKTPGTTPTKIAVPPSVANTPTKDRLKEASRRLQEALNSQDNSPLEADAKAKEQKPAAPTADVFGTIALASPPASSASAKGQAPRAEHSASTQRVIQGAPQGAPQRAPQGASQTAAAKTFTDYSHANGRAPASSASRSKPSAPQSQPKGGDEASPLLGDNESDSCCALM